MILLYIIGGIWVLGLIFMLLDKVFDLSNRSNYDPKTRSYRFETPDIREKKRQAVRAWLARQKGQAVPAPKVVPPKKTQPRSSSSSGWSFLPMLFGSFFASRFFSNHRSDSVLSRWETSRSEADASHAASHSAGSTADPTTDWVGFTALQDEDQDDYACLDERIEDYEGYDDDSYSDSGYDCGYDRDCYWDGDDDDEDTTDW